jgi:hypothetical protein
MEQILTKQTEALEGLKESCEDVLKQIEAYLDSSVGLGEATNSLRLTLDNFRRVWGNPSE